jgi:hypothetical protein
MRPNYGVMSIQSDFNPINAISISAPYESSSDFNNNNIVMRPNYGITSVKSDSNPINAISISAPYESSLDFNNNTKLQPNLKQLKTVYADGTICENGTCTNPNSPKCPPPPPCPPTPVDNTLAITVGISALIISIILIYFIFIKKEKKGGYYRFK